MFDQTPKNQNPQNAPITPSAGGVPPQGGPRPVPRMSASPTSEPEDIFADTPQMASTAPGRPISASTNQTQQPSYQNPPMNQSSAGFNPAQTSSATAPAPVPTVTSQNPAARGWGNSQPGDPGNPFIPMPSSTSWQGSSSDESFGKEALSRNQKIVLVLVAFLVAALLLSGAFFLYLYIQNRGVTDTTPGTVTNTTSTNTRNTNAVNTNTVKNVNAGLLNINSATTPTPTPTPSALLDSDNDGLSDADEVKYGTTTGKTDTDGDGFLDGEEVKNGYNPLGSGKLPGI